MAEKVVNLDRGVAPKHFALFDCHVFGQPGQHAPPLHATGYGKWLGQDTSSQKPSMFSDVPIRPKGLQWLHWFEFWGCPFFYHFLVFGLITLCCRSSSGLLNRQIRVWSAWWLSPFPRLQCFAHGVFAPERGGHIWFTCVRVTLHRQTVLLAVRICEVWNGFSMFQPVSAQLLNSFHNNTVILLCLYDDGWLATSHHHILLLFSIINVYIYIYTMSKSRTTGFKPDTSLV